MQSDQLKPYMLEILKEILQEQKYPEYSDTNQFLEISGISKNDFERKIVHHSEFEHCVHRLDENHKRYIHTQSGLDALKKIFKEVSV